MGAAGVVVGQAEAVATIAQFAVVAAGAGAGAAAAAAAVAVAGTVAVAVAAADQRRAGPPQAVSRDAEESGS